MTEEQVRSSGINILASIIGTDETFSQTVHSRSSYRADEVVVGARFKDMFLPARDGRPRIDMRRFHQMDGA
jgi:inward rectifier potassium channel